MDCTLCGSTIKDAEVLLAKGLHAPKYCEPCRHKVRSYRPDKPAPTHELLDAWVVRLDKSVIDNLVPQYIEGRSKRAQGEVYALGGRGFGPWGGASHSGKTLVHVHTTLEPGKAVQLRKMKKVAEEGSWIYLVIEDPAEPLETGLELRFRFTRVYKRTLKGLGAQIDDAYPVEEAHEVVLEGWSSSRSGRYGNTWKLYIVERPGEGVPLGEETDVEVEEEESE